MSDLHEALSAAVRAEPGGTKVGAFAACAATIEKQLAGGSYELDDAFFENLHGLLIQTPAPVPTPMGGPEAANNDYVQTFCVELAERLGLAQDLILRLEAGQATEDERLQLFRLFHTIKGEAGFLHLGPLLDLFHELENLLDALRKDRIAVGAELIQYLFRGVDLAERAGPLLNEAQGDLGTLVPAIHELKRDLESFLSGGGEAAVSPGLARTAEVATSRVEESLVKVSSAKLSYLVDMVGEMLILQNQMADDSKETQMLRKVSREVQQAAMSLRTVALRPLFTKMRRAVRDVSLQLSKPVTVDVVGDALEIDRTLVEAMEEPLLHLVRNSVGHGVEDSATRQAAGKTELGRITLSAERRGNHVILSIEDDGKGLDAQAILRTALKNEVVTPEVAETLTEEQIHNLIFLDGLSTAARVDDISGRGVGMSIVKKTVAQFRGHVHIRTVRGQGTRFDLVFPLSMAILDGMIIELGTEKFILPVENVLEAVRVQDGMLVALNTGGRVLRLRGEVVPVVDLSAFFAGREVESGVAVLIENNQHDRYAVLVERLLEKREVVIKSLGHRFERLVGISAAAILRGGEIGYLVDVDAITSGRQSR